MASKHTSSLSQVPNLIPDFEIKVLLQPDLALDADNRVLPEVLSVIGGADPTPVKMSVQFLDTDDQTLYVAGWSPRIRLIQGKDKFELTYKKRYTVLEHGRPDHIDAALTAANVDGFDASDTNYEAQLEWSLAKMTLSISREKKVPATGFEGVELPGGKLAREMLFSEAPGKFKTPRGKDKDWGVKTLKDARVYGPILADRYVGTFGGRKAYIEVWPIKMKPDGKVVCVVEVSLKVDNMVEALEHRIRLPLAMQAWKSPDTEQDKLKTKLIMENY